MNKIILLAVLVLLAICKDPPVLAGSFKISYDETFIVDGSKYIVNGQMLYDADHNRERVDRTNGRYDLFCSTIVPNISTPCTQITTNNKRYIIFPQRRQCCFCCSSEKGCGILRKDWLEGAEY